MKGPSILQRRFYTQDEVAGFLAVALVVGGLVGALIGFILAP